MVVLSWSAGACFLAVVRGRDNLIICLVLSALFGVVQRGTFARKLNVNPFPLLLLLLLLFLEFNIPGLTSAELNYAFSSPSLWGIHR